MSGKKIMVQFTRPSVVLGVAYGKGLHPVPEEAQENGRFKVLLRERIAVVMQEAQATAVDDGNKQKEDADKAAAEAAKKDAEAAKLKLTEAAKAAAEATGATLKEIGENKAEVAKYVKGMKDMLKGVKKEDTATKAAVEDVIKNLEAGQARIVEFETNAKEAKGGIASAETVEAIDKLVDSVNDAAETVVKELNDAKAEVSKVATPA